jgi:hypothetical protein
MLYRGDDPFQDRSTKNRPVFGLSSSFGEPQVSALQRAVLGSWRHGFLLRAGERGKKKQQGEYGQADPGPNGEAHQQPPTTWR